jgi:hypothetical protein
MIKRSDEENELLELNYSDDRRFGRASARLRAPGLGKVADSRPRWRHYPALSFPVLSAG